MTLAMFALAYLAVLRAHLHAQQASQQTPTSRRRHRHTTSKTQVAKGPYQQPIDVSGELLPLTMPEIRHVLWTSGQAISAEAITLVLMWSDWRRRHQARARRCHYQRHLPRA